MKMSQLVGGTLKETPRDTETLSHIFCLRGPYARAVSTGIFSLLPVAKRITRKIEQILREEMDRIDGQEVQLPVVLPAELWEESGRYESVGPELLRFQNRNTKKMILGMTHEEAVVQLLRTEIHSYKQLPLMIYQIQTKYRDEARPRAGLIRVREFTMKDAYSCHASTECLSQFYDRVHEAYVRIFKRIGMKEVISIKSDTGMMGGSVSHEFMALADCGEDTIFVSPGGEYKANREIATTTLSYQTELPKPLEKVHTPGMQTIADLAKFLNVSESQTGKAVFFADSENKLVFAVIRGDIEVNEVKLRNYLRDPNLRRADDALIRSAGAEPGFASPIDIDPSKIRILFDPSAAKTPNLVVGANEVDYHYRNFNFERDLRASKANIEIVDIGTVRPGDPCPVTGEPLVEKKGIEVGNIFQLGTKYSESMQGNFLDINGKSQAMIMGSYGIGVERALAAVIEQSHDDYGPIWPISIAPFQVHICALNYNKEDVQLAANSIYKSLIDNGIEVLLDDRNAKAGPTFNDADLIGIPFRIIVSPKTLKNNEVEWKTRDGSQKEMLPLDSVAETVASKVESLLKTEFSPN